MVFTTYTNGDLGDGLTSGPELTLMVLRSIGGWTWKKLWHHDRMSPIRRSILFHGHKRHLTSWKRRLPRPGPAGACWLTPPKSILKKNATKWLTRNQRLQRLQMRWLFFWPCLEHRQFTCSWISWVIHRTKFFCVSYAWNLGVSPTLLWMTAKSKENHLGRFFNILKRKKTWDVYHLPVQDFTSTVY